MFSLVPKILISLFVMSSLALASESKEEPKEGHSAPAKEVKSAEESFSVVQARVQGLEAKIHSSEAEIKKLIEEKQRTTDPQKLNEIIRTMLTLHKDLANNIKEYDQQRTLLKYRYPEKGQTEKREYERIDLKSIEDMENQMSLGSTLKKTLKKVRLQYAAPDSKGASKKSQEGVSQEPSKPQPGLVDPVILKK